MTAFKTFWGISPITMRSNGMRYGFFKSILRESALTTAMIITVDYLGHKLDQMGDELAEYMKQEKPISPELSKALNEMKDPRSEYQIQMNSIPY